MGNFQNSFSIFQAIGSAFAGYWWIVFPVAFYYLFKFIWMDYIVFGWLDDFSSKNILLEIIPPKNIEKGPKPMESFFSGIAGVSNTINPFDKYLKGVVMHRFSLELVGAEGQIHFYVRTDKKFRDLIEANIYAQYPDAEVFEVEDYTENFPQVIPNKYWDLWGSDMQMTMPDPYPIRTYDDFEESITGRMVDPMASIVEVLGRLGPGQHIWLQYIIWPQLEGWRTDQMKIVEKLAGREKEKAKGIREDLGDVFGNVIKGFTTPVEFKKDEKKEEQPLEFKLTPVEKDILKKVEENLGRNVFCTKMRYIILAKKEVFDKSIVSTFTGALKQFNDQNLNNFKPHDKSKTFSNYLFKDSRLQHRQRKIYRRYKYRSMDGILMTMSTKELATVFHFPDIDVKSPNFVQVDSKKGSAPANLPIFQ